MMMEPLVSCMMVTRPSVERLPLLRRSLDCYLRQSYQRRELIIVLDAAEERDRQAVEAHVAGLGRTDIRVVSAPGKPTLGQLRNLAMSVARGDLLCVWDDDDIHHPERLARQQVALASSGALATFLSEALHLFLPSGEVYWANYRNTVQRCLPGTGLISRTAAARYPEQGPDCQRGEDTTFCLRLLEEGPVHFLDDAAELYLYVSHGTNTSGLDHHRMLARTLGVTRGRLARREAAVREALDRAGLDLPQIVVQGSNGVAFTWQPSTPC